MVHQRAKIEALPAYVQGKSLPDAVKLSSNENPYPPLESVLQATHERLSRFNLYPDMGAIELRERIAARHGVRLEEVSVGAGSVEVLSQLINASADEGDEVIFAWRSFEAYPILIQVAGAEPVRVPLTADERHDLDAMAAAVTERTRLILICTPNNPTGTTVHADELERFMAKVPEDVLVVIDEAYVHFDNDPKSVDGLDFFRRYPNIAVLHTFSKAYGLAGLRVGYAIGHKRILDAARSTAVPLSVTAQSEEAALTSLAAEDELLARVRTIAERRDRLAAALRAQGWAVPDAQGNFVWLATGEQTMDAAALFEDGGCIVRPFAGDGIRISVGEEESVEKVLQIAASIVEALPEGHAGRALA